MSQKTVKKEKKNIKSDKQFRIENIYLILTCALIFFPLFFRGLFFERELRVVHIITFTLILFWFLYKYRDRSYSLIRFKYEYFLFAFVAMYFITVPFSASHRAALMEGLKYANYLAIYILVRDQVRENKRDIKIFDNTIVAGAFALSLVGLMNYFGFMNNTGALAGNRICSTLQYPNTLAAVIGAAVFITLSLLVVSNKKLELVYAGILNILFITFILTFSRTMWLLLPVIFIAYIFITLQKKKLEVLLLSLSTILPSLIAAGMLTAYMGEKSFISIAIVLISALISIVLVTMISKFKLGTLSNKAFGSIVIGIILLFSIVGIVAVNTTQPVTLSHYNAENGYVSFGKSIYSIEGKRDYLLKLDIKTEQLEKKPWLGRVAITSFDKGWEGKTIKDYYIRKETDGIVEIPFNTCLDTYYITVDFYNYFKDTSFTIKNAHIIDTATGNVLSNVKLDYKYLPSALASRLQDINLKHRSVQERLVFFKDAFKIIKNNMIIGLGGGGWKASYMAYRSYEYWSTQTHSYPIQVWIETGVLGFLLMLGFLTIYFSAIYKNYKDSDVEDGKPEFLGIVLFILTILLHSLVDFDLSLGAVSILLWASLALATRHFKKENILNKKVSYLKPVSIILVMFLLFTNMSMGLASHFNNETKTAIDNKEFDKIEKYAAIAVKLDPFNSTYRENLARITDANRNLEDKIRYQKSGMQLEKAIKNDSYDFKIYGEMALHQFKYGKFDLVLEYLDKAIHYNPAISDTYMQKMDFLFNISKYFYKKNEYDTAVNQLKEIKNVEKVIAGKNKELERPIKIKPALLSHIYKANYVLNNINNHINNRHVFDVANLVIMFDDFDFDSNADLLPDLWQIPYQEDKIVEGCIIEEDGIEAFKVTSDNPSFFIRKLNLSLEPSSRYLVAVEGKSKSGEGKMTALISSNSGKREQFKEGNIALGEEYTIYQNTFETSDDIEPGDQYIRLYFNDKEGEVMLGRIVIIKLK